MLSCKPIAYQNTTKTNKTKQNKTTKASSRGYTAPHQASLFCNNRSVTVKPVVSPGSYSETQSPG